MSATLALLGPIGGPEMIMIFVVILLLFGAKKLPDLARGIGKSMGEFKKARDEFEHELTRSDVAAHSHAVKSDERATSQLEAEIARLKSEAKP